jgi:hypothetical protein
MDPSYSWHLRHLEGLENPFDPGCAGCHGSTFRAWQQLLTREEALDTYAAEHHPHISGDPHYTANRRQLQHSFQAFQNTLHSRCELCWQQSQESTKGRKRIRNDLAARNFATKRPFHMEDPSSDPM